jgi:hypothetical protein
LVFYTNLSNWGEKVNKINDTSAKVRHYTRCVTAGAGCPAGAVMRGMTALAGLELLHQELLGEHSI